MSAILPPSKHLKPVTFGQRGVYTRFTGETLRNTRIRRGDLEYELLIEGFSGADGVYVVPASRLGSLIPLNLHDQALLAMVTRVRTIDPIGVRSAALKVAKSGLGGPELKAEAEKRLQQDRKDQLAHFHRILSTLSPLEGVPKIASDHAAVDPRTDAGSQCIESVLAAASPHLDLDTETLRLRVQAMVTALSPVAADDSGHPGWLFRAYRRLQAFSDGLSASGDVTSQNFALLTETLARTLARGAQAVEALGKAQADILALLRSWDGDGERTARQEAMRLAWLMDGWEPICDLWEATADDERQPRYQILETIARIAPILPKSEDEAAPATDNHRVGLQGRRMVRAYQDWRTGVADEELLLRMKGAAAAPEAPKPEPEPETAGEFLL